MRGIFQLASLALAPVLFAQPSITTTTCPSGTQGQAYAGCTIAATGGTPPYTFSFSISHSFAYLPEGMSLNSSTGVVSSSLIGGRGQYGVNFIVTDSAMATGNQTITFSLAGADDTYLQKIFPANSIFRHRMDAASTGLPVSTSPADTIIGTAHALKANFGANSGSNMPFGIPVIKVPGNQAFVGTVTYVFQSYFTSAPFPPYQPVENTITQCCDGASPNVYLDGTTGANGDAHAFVYIDSSPPALYEAWNAVPCTYASVYGQSCSGGQSWLLSSNATWTNLTSNALTPQCPAGLCGTSNAAGLPYAELLLTPTEVNGSGSKTSPNGGVNHISAFTLAPTITLNYHEWPGTSDAGGSTCHDGSGMQITTKTLLSQSSPPATCGRAPAFGSIQRLKASVYNSPPACMATSPQANIIMTGLYQFGMIMIDNGSNGFLQGVPDTNWNDSDLNCLGQLTLANFEPVNVSSLMLNSDTGDTPSGGGSSVTGTFTGATVLH